MPFTPLSPEVSGQVVDMRLSKKAQRFLKNLQNESEE
jgi:hypothetical protein